MDMFKSGDYNILPIHITIIGLFCSTSWLLYGILNGQDWNIIVPNLLGEIFGIITMMCWIFFYNKARKEKGDVVKNQDTETAEDHEYKGLKSDN